MDKIKRIPKAIDRSRMASHRPYRPSLGIVRALNEIEKNRGTLYDEAVVDTCLKLFREKGFRLEM
jgi:HD-GYP domain-containing protein (c-di-GMP phosphodiesterase class II)